MEMRADTKLHADADAVTAAKRARQEKSRQRVESGEKSQQSMFLIAPSVVRKIKFHRRTTDF
jgi:hypothetical protein